MSDSTQVTTASKGADLGLVFVALIAGLSLVFSFVAFAVGDGGDDAAGAGEGAAVTLSEFAIAPDPVEVESGGSLQVTNAGTQAHNLKVAGTDLGTADLAGDAGETLDLSSLDPGSYEIFCSIPGHKEAGMAGELVVGGGGDGGGGHSAAVDYQAMDDAMEQSIMEFPAETEGRGNQPLEPTVLEDGTKSFELTAAITPWEVEPGKIVDAWTYNGIAPGPWIKVAVGDKVRVHIQNDLPMGTDIHWHGMKVDNAQDGVAPITQKLIRSGEDYTYEFTARHAAVAMYHAHHHGQMQVPNGLFGFLQVGDVALPRGRTISGIPIPDDLTVSQEIPMVLNDAGVIGLTLNGKSFPATEPVVLEKGSWAVIHYLNEGLLAHPMHLHEFPQLVVARDGIPLDNPYWADTINVAPGERYSVLVQADEPGTWVWHCHILNHAEREDGMFGMVTALVVS